MKKNNVVVSKAAKKAATRARRNLAAGLPMSAAVCKAVDDTCPAANLGGHHPAQAALLAAIFGGSVADIRAHLRLSKQVRALLEDVSLDQAGYLRGHPASPVTQLGL